MPELPEVETIRAALAAELPGKRVEKILVRDPRLRWPVDSNRLGQLITGETVDSVARRAKYLLVRMRRGSTLILHLGMSGRLLLLTQPLRFEKHDHVIFSVSDGRELRFRDPRRFGLVDAIPPGGEAGYPRLAGLGPEPLARSTNAEQLHARATTLSRPIKNLLMDSRFIVGVGNIYASEALFRAGIHPLEPAGNLGREQWVVLLKQIRKVLNAAIKKGGTTLNDFVNSNGETGYFQLSLAVYGRTGEPCLQCGAEIRRVVLSGRSTFFCEKCQKSENLPE